MPIPNTAYGGEIHVERERPSPYNAKKLSRATYANEPNEPGWEHEGEMFKEEPARQCAAENFFYRFCNECDTRYHIAQHSECPECHCKDYYLKRCTFCAEPGKMTCKSHGANTKLSREHRDKMTRGSIKTGASFADIMLCPCKMHSDECSYAGQLVDEARYGSTVPRCILEQELFDVIVQEFKEEYELDDVADMLMLNRLAMTFVREKRGEKIMAKYGDTVERTKNFPDGTIESWWEPSASASMVDSLDRRLQAWLKELQVSRAARNAAKNKQVIAAKFDLTSILSSDTTTAEYEDIVDVDTE